MNTSIETFKKLVIQIATPYSTGTGFYLQEYNLFITNEHVVRDNKYVVIQGEELNKQLAEVVFLDQVYDLAFLKIKPKLELPEVSLEVSQILVPGDKILAIGYPFGRKYETRKGKITQIEDAESIISYFHHNATLSAGNSGGPLIHNGMIVGINTFIGQDEEEDGFSLPAKYLEQSLQEFKEGKDKSASRCFACSKLVFENTKKLQNCVYCGAFIQLPSEIEPYESSGVAKTIELLLAASGHDIELSRSGHLQWEIEKGSAKIDISYYDKTGLIIGDAYLCKLPSDNQNTLYEFLLRQNYEIEGLSFSVKGHDIVLSLLINDRYLNIDTGKALLNHLFERADYYDDILVEKYGASRRIKEN